MKLTKDEKRDMGNLRDERDLKTVSINTHVRREVRDLIRERLAYLDISMSKYMRELILEDLDDSGMGIFNTDDQEFMQ
jgi:hypothetical protein